VWSYFDPYVDFTGRITGFAVVDLHDLGTYDWRFARQNMWKAEKFLIDYRHRRLHSSDRRYRRLHAAYKVFRQQHPDAPALHYRGRERWMPV